MSPWAPPRPCPGPRCPNLIRGAERRCPSCETAYGQTRRLDPRRRAQQDVYGTAAWKTFRAGILVARPWCQCGCGRASDTVAHIKPVLHFPALIFEASNVRALTKACHSRESATRGERWPR